MSYTWQDVNEAMKEHGYTKAGYTEQEAATIAAKFGVIRIVVPGRKGPNRWDLADDIARRLNNDKKEADDAAK